MTLMMVPFYGETWEHVSLLDTIFDDLINVKINSINNNKN